MTVSGPSLFLGMWYVKPSYDGKLSRSAFFDRARVMVLEDQYSYVTALTAKEGKIRFGAMEDSFCDPRYHAKYCVSRRGDSLLTQLSKLQLFAETELQQVRYVIVTNLHFTFNSYYLFLD